MSGPLEPSLLRFLSWLDANRQFFAFRRADYTKARLSLLKPFSEFVLGIDVLLSHGVPYPAAREHLDWAWGLVDEGEHLFQLMAARPDLFQLASVYANFRRHGYSNRRVERLLCGLARMRSVRHVELELWVRLSFHHALSRLGMAPYDLRHARDSWLMNTPEPWTLTDGIAYSVTHEVFYATDFGCARSRLPADVEDYLRLWVPAWARFYVAAGNWDITAELLMVGDCIGDIEWPEDPLPALLREQRPKGWVPGPEGAGSQLLQPESSAEERHFLGVYHTTLVAALAVALRGSRCRAR